MSRHLAIVAAAVIAAASCTRDNELMRDAINAGGAKYAGLCALAYRQTLAAHKLIVTPEGDLAYLSKECDSNGSIGTVDLSYPSSPLFLIYNPDLAKALIDFIFHYTECGRWTSPFPAHDVGTYPIADGQTFIDDMPVEEAGNMLILTDAICKVEGRTDYALRHWDALTRWAEYLMENGAEPVDQLCTDDFAGRLLRNANLSAKAILALAAHGDMARMAGKDDTWSQKYNLVWDRILGYDIFDDDIIETEADWITWTAAKASDMDDFEAIVAPVYRFFNETVDRVPMTDWYNTDSPTYMHFKARSVVGGFFMKMFDMKYNGR